LLIFFRNESEWLIGAVVVSNIFYATLIYVVELNGN